MVTVDANGNLNIVINTECYNPAEAWVARRQALYNLITQRSTDYTDEETLYYAVELLQDLEPTHEQFELITEHKK